uniref:Transmembrane protein n=1 Tax=viral metagenome TaxID=1070528 RepID=A0A6C0KS23_9ZZZZ
MSDSLLGTMLTNLKNKATYHAFNAVTDPNANQFVSEQSAPLLPPKADDTPPEDSDATDGDPNTFSASRFAKKIWKQFSSGTSTLIVPIVALILSMYVTNEMIVYSVPIRLIFFIFTFFICFTFTPFLVILGGYYLCKWGYQYYLNELSDGPKAKIMPTIFALLPLTTTQPITSLGYFFMYPFTYPKNEKDAKQLPIIMNNYMESLKKAFTYFNKVQNLPFIAEGFKKLSDNIEHLHDIPKVPEKPSETKNAPMPPVIVPINKNGENVKNTVEAPMPPAYNNTESTSNDVSPPAYNNAPKNAPPAYNNTTTSK